MDGEASWPINQPPTHKPPGFGLALPGIYAVWLFAVVALYPTSRWFADLKQRRREWWWSICRRPVSSDCDRRHRLRSVLVSDHENPRSVKQRRRPACRTAFIDV